MMDLTKQGPQCVPLPSPGMESVSYYTFQKLERPSEICKHYKIFY
jgi:hypothetical protein